MENPVNSLPKGFVLEKPNIALPEGFILEKEQPLKQASFLNIPSMPKDAPAVTPVPKEQTKVYGMLEGMPSPMRTEIEKSAIQRQREKEFGVIKKAPSFQLSEAISNIPENISDIIKETGSLLMNIGRLSGKATGAYFGDVFDPMSDGKRMREFTKPAREAIDTIKEEGIGSVAKKAIKPIKEDIKTKGFWNSVGQFVEERPVDTLLIGQALKTAVGSGVRLTAQTTRKAIPEGVKVGDKLDVFLSTERTPVVFEMPVEILPKSKGGVAPKSETTFKVAKAIEFPREYSKDPFTKYIFQKSFDSILNKFPKAKQALAEHKSNKLIDGLRTTYDNANFTERVKIQGEVMKQINTLSKEERAVVVPYLEGRVALISEPSETFKKFENWYRDLSGKIQADLSTASKLSPEVIQARLYQPLEKATGLTKEQIIGELGDFTPAYVHHAFPDIYSTKMGTFFADTTGKRYKPGFLKKSKGVGGYSENLKEILPKWTAEYVKFKNTEAFLSDFTQKFGIPVNIKNVKNVSGGFQVGGRVYKGYKIVAPDGFLSFYKGKIDFYKEVSNRLTKMDFDEAIGEVIKETTLSGAPVEGITRQTQIVVDRVKEALKARGFAQGEVEQMINRVKSTGGNGQTIIREKLIKSGMKKEDVENLFLGMKKEFVGVSKNKPVYLVPDNITKHLESYATPLFGSQKIQNTVKLVYDKPVQIWKDSVLAASPRWIKNNVIGDIIFNSTEGVGPLSYGRSFTSTYKDLIPDELIGASFANTMKYNPQLGMAARSTIGGLIDDLYKTKPVKGISKAKDFGYALNSMFEKPFVRSLYINLARKKAKDLLMVAKKPVTEESILGKLAEIKNSSTLNKPIINKVKETLPVFDLTGNFERKYLKRLMPFYNWYKFMIQYSAKLPFNHPFKTVGARGLGALSEDQREEAFKQSFPYMSREVEESGIPDRFDNLWPVGKTDTDGKAIFFNARGFNVFTTVEDLTKGNLLNMTSPLVKIPIERATGRESFTGREYKTGEEGIGFKGKEKQLPSLGEHFLKQFPQYELLKQTLVPARQYDTGTLFNPDPILDKITGEYKYPIESLERLLNYSGIDKKTLDIRKVWDNYQQQKATAIGQTFQKYQSKADTALSFKEVKELFDNIKRDKNKWSLIVNEVKENALQKAKEKKELINKVNQ